MKDKLIILYGGPSSEREVSFGTKDFFYDLYKDLNPIPVEWTTDNKFCLNNDRIIEEAFLNYLSENNLTALIASHGEYVEDGYIQSRFENNKIPFTGSDSKSCKLAMNKTKTQESISHIVKTIPTSQTYGELNFPFIAKPNALGSSVGIYLIKNEEDLENASKKFDKNYIFQPYIKGRELSLGSVRDGEVFIKLNPTEIKPKKDFFDYEAKYVTGMAEEVTPAAIGSVLTDEIVDVTNKTHDALGLGYYSRSDFILTQDESLYYLETNALPGMTKTSLIPQQLNYASALEQFKEGLIKNLIGSS